MKRVYRLMVPIYIIYIIVGFYIEFYSGVSDIMYKKI